MKKLLPLLFFTFLLNYAFAQETCETAIVASSGTNTLPATKNSEYWYEYTATQDGKIQISSSAGNDINIYSGVDCSSLSYEVNGYNNLVFTGLVNGETFYIQWYVFSGGNFDWTLTESAVIIGEDCNNAAFASTGTNNVPATTISEYWYKYTATQDGKIKINSSDNSNVTIYSGSNCSLLVNEVSGYNQIEFKQVLTDETYFIRWILNNGGNFDWTLTESLLEPGDTCEDPVEAVLGSNTSGATKFWFQFTAPSAGNYIISSVGTTTIDTYLKVFSDCSETLINKNDDFEDYQSQVKVSLNSGQVIYILWDDTYSPYGFDWTLTEASGDDCNSAVLANAGTNTMPATANEEFWYEYTATRDGKIQINSPEGNGIYIYSGTDCTSLSLETIGGRNFSFTGATNGVTYYIQWLDYPEGYFEWTLTESDIEPGDDCVNAATASLGTNTVPATTNSEFWYKYTATLDGKIRINSSAGKHMMVYSGSDCYSRTFIKNRTNFVNIPDVVSGQTYYIKWSAAGGDFDWTLTESPIQPGDSCGDPVQAVLGNNTSEYASFWFEFTAPSAGNYTISTVGTTSTDTWLKVYFDCNDFSGHYESDDFSGLQSQVTLSLTEGQVIYILWDDGWSPLGFDWTLSSDIGQMEQTISFNALDNKSFGDADFELTATASSGLNVNYSSSDETVATIDGSTLSIVGAGITTITASQSGNDYYHSANNIERTLIVEKADQTLTFDIADQEIGNAPFSVSASSNSGLTNFTFDVVEGSASISGSTLTLDGTEGFVEVSATESGNDNYNSATISTTFQVKDPSKTDQTITFSSLSDKTFGDADFELTATASSGLEVIYTSSNPEVATVNGSTVTVVGAGSTTITASQGGDANFNIALPVNQTLTVNKANQAISIEEIADKAITATPFDVVASATSGLDLTYTISGPASIIGRTITLDGTLGEVTVTVSQAGNINYNAAEDKSVSFIVYELTTQTITFNAIEDQLFSNETLTLEATTSSGLEVTYEIISGPATVSGNVVSFTDLGEVFVSASQAGNDTYAPATSVEQSFTIFKNEQAITFEPIEDQFFEAGSLTLSATASSGLEVSYDIVSGPATVTGNVVSFSDLGTIVVSANQAGNNSFLAAVSVEQSFDVITVTGVDGETSSLLIYPNPASNVLTIRTQQENAVIELLNLNGLVVMNIRPNAENNISHLSNGVYFLRISAGADYSVHKIIKK